MTKKHFVLSYPPKEISYFDLFKANLNKFKTLSFFKRYITALAETPPIDFLVLIEDKLFRLRETLMNNLSDYSYNQVREILFEKKNTRITSSFSSINEAKG